MSDATRTLHVLLVDMQRYWFKRKTFGYGWQPATWEGWLVIALYVAALIYVTSTSGDVLVSGDRVMQDFVAPVLILTAILVAISWRTGEPLKWQWGSRKEK